MIRRGGWRLLLATLVVATVGLAGAAGATAQSPTGGVATLQNGTADSVSVDTAFVGAVADEGTVTVTATGLLDGEGETVDGQRVTVTVGNDPVTTAPVENGTLTTAFQPDVLDLDPQDSAPVALHGFDTAVPPTVEVVHEALALDAGYSLHSVPQGAEVVAEGVAAVNVWDPGAGTYDAVTDPVFDSPDDLNRALSLAVTGDDARLGHTFATDDVPTPGQETLGEGWNFIGSNFDIATSATTTVQADLVGVDAANHTVFAADFSEELDPDDTVGPYEGYWVFVDGGGVERGTLGPTYSADSRQDTLGIDGSEFRVTGLDVATSETDSGGLVEVTATVENQGDSLDTQFVDLLAGNNTGGFERVDRVGVELAGSDSRSVTVAYNVDQTVAVDVQLRTDDDEMTKTVTWDDPFFAVSNLSFPAQAEEGESISVNATVENSGFAGGTQDVLFRLDEFGNFDDPEVELVVGTVTLAPGESQTVGLTVEAPSMAGEFEHGIFTANDSQTASLPVGGTQVVGVLGDTSTGVDGDTVTVDLDIESTDDTERDVRVYELDVTFDPSVVSFIDATLAEFPESASLVVNDEAAAQGRVRLVALSTEQALTPVTAGTLEFDPVGRGETALAIDAGESDIEGPGGQAHNPVWTDESITVTDGLLARTRALTGGSFAAGCGHAVSGTDGGVTVAGSLTLTATEQRFR